MTTQENKPTPADELHKLLTDFGTNFEMPYKIMHDNEKTPMEQLPFARQQLIDETEAALNAYILTEILAIIGEDKPITGHMRPQGYPTFDMTESYRTEFRAELRKAVIARFGKGGDRG